MQPAQIELEDWAWAVLREVSTQKGVGISDLIQLAVQEKYRMTDPARIEAFREWRAPWRDRDDIGDAETFVRALRDDTRLARLYSE